MRQLSAGTAIAWVIFSGVTLMGQETSAEERKAVYRGTQITYRNTVSARSFDKANEPNYDPYYAMSLSLAPRFWFNEMLWINSSFSMTRELTQPNGFVEQGELVLSDLNFALGASRLYTVPVVEVAISSDVRVTLPMSPYSQAQTLQYAIAPGFSLSRSFGLLDGLSFSYAFRATFNDHRYTTSERETPVISSCAPTDGTCARFLNTGVRNTQQSTAHNVGMSLSPLSGLSLSAGLGVYINDLYKDSEIDGQSFQPQTPTDTRHAISYSLALSYRVISPLTATLGMSTFNPQRDPSSEYYDSVYNRYTQFYVDLGLDVATLVRNF